MVGFVDTAGQLAIPTAFEEAGTFHEGRCPVKVKGAWQIIDARGVLIASGVPPDLWNDAEDFHNGLARVHVGGQFRSSHHGPNWWKGGKWFYVDRSGTIVTVCRNDGDELIEPPFGKENVGIGH